METQAAATGVTLWGLTLRKDKKAHYYSATRGHAPRVGRTMWLECKPVGHIQPRKLGWSIYWTNESRINMPLALKQANYLWETKPQTYADAWTDSPGYEKIIAYDKLYTASSGGVVYCYDIKQWQTLVELHCS